MLHLAGCSIGNEGSVSVNPQGQNAPDEGNVASYPVVALERIRITAGCPDLSLKYWADLHRPTDAPQGSTESQRELAERAAAIVDDALRANRFNCIEVLTTDDREPVESAAPVWQAFEPKTECRESAALPLFAAGLGVETLPFGCHELVFDADADGMTKGRLYMSGGKSYRNRPRDTPHSEEPVDLGEAAKGLLTIATVAAVVGGLLYCGLLNQKGCSAWLDSWGNDLKNLLERSKKSTDATLDGVAYVSFPKGRVAREPIRASLTRLTTLRAESADSAYMTAAARQLGEALGGAMDSAL